MQRAGPPPKTFPHLREPRLRALLASAILLAVAPLAIAARPQRAPGRLDPFEHAERLREALEGRPEQQRTRLQYERVLDAYRAIYHSDPASPRADASIAAVADLLAEEGRVFQDEMALHNAIGQYEFLRHQYPATRFRFSALLTEGEIYQRDLGDTAQAKMIYESFLRQYPQNALAEEARVELKKIQHEELASEQRRSRGRYARGGENHRNTILAAAIQSPQESVPRRYTEPANTAPAARARPAAGSGRIEESDIPPPVFTPMEVPATREQTNRASENVTADTAAPDTVDMNAPPPPLRGAMPLITGIRHWSTPEYTRVAIDLQKEVRYQAARVPHPDRIFFDLYGVRLSPELVGRSVEVIDDGFLTRVRAAQFSSDVVRIVLDVNSVSDYSAFFLPNPSRLIIDVHGRKGAPPIETAIHQPPPGVREAAAASSTFESEIPAPVHPAPASAVHTGLFPGIEPTSTLADVAKLSSQPNQVRATRHPTTAPVVASVPDTTPAPQPGAVSRSPYRLTKPSPDVPATDEVPPVEAGATGVPARAALTGDQHLPTSMVRALGLKINRIVIDAGHGGHDSGTLGPGGLEEKDVVLDVALRLGKLLKQRLGADVIYTRTDDTFIPLETRTAIANLAQADLFISIHANSSSDPEARGVETYYLNFTTSADALEVAARENAVSDESIHQLSDLVKKIALQDKINESREFASDVEESLFSGLEQGNPGLKDRGVKKAPFVVLIGANMPSILAEISFLTNPDDARELRQPAYRERIAEALYRGVARYVSNLNGIRIAQAGSHPSASE